jgi:hypothetical protein
MLMPAMALRRTAIVLPNVAIPCGQKIKTAGKTRGYPIPA